MIVIRLLGVEVFAIGRQDETEPPVQLGEQDLSTYLAVQAEPVVDEFPVRESLMF